MANNQEENQSDQSPVREAQVLDGFSTSQTLDALKLRFASKIAPRRWRKPLLQLSDAVEKQTTLEDAYTKASPRLPRELNDLFREAMRMSDPTGTLLRALRVREELSRNWKMFTGMIAYPAILLVFATLIALTFSFVLRNMIRFSGFEDFGLAGFDQTMLVLDDSYNAVLGLGFLVLWTSITLLTIRFLGPSWSWSTVIGGFRIIGRPLRWISLQEILMRFELFAEPGIGTQETANRVARSFAYGSQAIATRVIAGRIEAGVPVGEAIGRSVHSDGLCRPALLLIDSSSEELRPAVRKCSEMLGVLVEQRCRVLGVILPIFVLLLIGSLVIGVLNSYFMILMSLVSMISSLT